MTVLTEHAKMLKRGPFAERPLASVGRYWFLSDEGGLYKSDGSSWTTVIDPGATGVTFGTPAVTLGTAAANGSTDEAIRRDSTIVAFDATVPATQAFGDSAATGSAAVAARRDHKHAMPAAPTAASVGADPAGSAAAAAAASVPLTLFDANTILKADSDDTPTALAMGASTILARLAAGGIVAATPAELRTLLALVIGTNVQAWDADLDSLASVGLTAAGLALLDDANAAAQRTTLGLGSLATLSAISSSEITDGTIVAADIANSARARDWRALSVVSGAIMESIPRSLASNNGALLATGRLNVVAIPVLANDVITSVSFNQATTAFTAATHAWFALIDSALNVIRQSTDQLAAGITANATTTLAMDSVPVTAGARVASTTVTLTFPTLSQALSDLFAPGDTIVVSNANIAAYNGTFTIVTVTSTQITYVSGGTATDSLAAPFPTVRMAAGKRTYTVPSDGYVYAGIMLAGTVGTHVCAPAQLTTANTSKSPIDTATSSSSLTGTCPSPIGALSSSSLLPWAALS